jgi:hypothetical protein
VSRAETAATIGAAASRANGINTAMVWRGRQHRAADLVLLEDDRNDQLSMLGAVVARRRCWRG